MGSRLFGVLLFSIFLVVFSLAPPTGKKTLVLLGKETLKTTHSEFFDALKAKGFRLTFNSVDNDNLNLQKYGEYLYDHLIIFASSEEFGAIDVDSVLRFIDSGNNLLLATDSEISDSVRELALECGVEFDEQQTAVIDHFNYDSQDDGKHTLILAKQAVDATVIFDTPNPVLFRGVGFSLMENNALIIPLLSGHSTSFSHALDKPVTNLHSAGKNTVLVAALQARNNARVVISGSIELFSNEFFQSTVKSSREGHVPSGNSDFALDVTLWAFQQKGVLQASDAVHHKLSGSETPGYRIKDTVEYQVKIKEWKDNEWVPFKAEDVQLEFVRLDPYIRTFLKHDNNGLFSTSFVIPDVLGVYTFRLVHNRLGYSYLKLADSIPVRPFRHNEYERFIPAAFPYYASAFSMMFGFSLFSCFFLYHRSEKVKTA